MCANKSGNVYKNILHRLKLNYYELFKLLREIYIAFEGKRFLSHD